MFAPKVAKNRAPQHAKMFARPPAGRTEPTPAPTHDASRASWDLSGVPLAAPDRANGRRTGVPQAKLVMGRNDDPLEHEADRIADRVMSRDEAAGAVRVASRPASRAPAEPEVARAKPADGRGPGEGEAPDIVADAIRAPAQPLDPALRTQFERRFDYDFGQVRVHRYGIAARSAASVGARAYTVGRDVVFGAGHYAPDTDSGARLLAHELTHVAQQGPAGVVRRDGIASAQPTPDPTRAKLSPQQIELIDRVLRRHQVVVFMREKRAMFDGRRTDLAQAIALVRREAGILLPSDEAIAAYIDSQFYKYLPGGGAGSGSSAAGGPNSSGLLRGGIPMPYGLDRPGQTLEPGLTGADVDRIRNFLTTGGLATGPGLRPLFNGGPVTLDQITEQCRALVLPIIPRDKVAAIVGAEWSILVRKALQAPVPPPPPFTIAFDDPPARPEVPDKPDKLASAIGWQGTWHLVRKAKFEHTIQVQLAQGDGSVQRIYQFQVNTTTGDVQAMLGVQAQSPDVTLVDTKLFKAVHATVKASAFVQLVAGITNAGGNSASGALTLQLQGGVQAAVTLGPVSATVQVGPTLTLQQGQSPDFSLNPAGQGGGTQLPNGAFPPFHGIPLIQGTF